MYQITQLSPTPETVITLGQPGNVPLIRSPSELFDRLEPHDHIYSAVRTREHLRGSHGAAGVYPGWCRLGGWEGLYRVLTSQGQIEAYLWNIENKPVKRPYEPNIKEYILRSEI